MKETSWTCTLITQLSLCIAAYISLNMGHQRKLIHGNISSEGRPSDMYFISVAGGRRPLEEQTLLLEQMAKVAKTYKARFVVDINNLGGSDPLLQNAIAFPELPNIPWYTTGASGSLGETYFLKKIEIPYGQTLDIIALDTVLLQDMASVHGNHQIQWLARTLNESEADWKIVVGYHELISCDYNILKMEEGIPIGPLHSMLLPYGVDAYISMKMCDGHVHEGAVELSVTGLTDKGSYLSTMDQNLVFKDSSSETVNGFLLHQIGSLGMATFVVKLTGEVEHRISFQQRGRAVM